MRPVRIDFYVKVISELEKLGLLEPGKYFCDTEGRIWKLYG